VKVFSIAILVALALLQQTGGRDIESGYRANNRGVALLEQFNYDGAAAAFREALTISPDLGIARVNLAIALFYGNKAAEAADAARAGVSALPASPTSHYVAGLIAKTDNRLDEATAAFERVLQIDPNDPGTKVQLGQIRTQERRYDDAIALFQGALTAEPYNVTAAYSVALALTRGGRAEEGRQAMQRFDTLRASAYGVTYAQTYLSQGRYAEGLTSTGSERSLVNRVTPPVSFREAPADFLPSSSGNSSQQPGAGSQQPGKAIVGGFTLVDIDNDGDLDIVDAKGGSAHLWRKDERGFTDRTAATRLDRIQLDGVSGIVAGDFDNDTRPDLLLVGSGGYALLHQAVDGGFDDVTRSAALPRPPGSATTAAFVDVDHDGDLDLVVAGTAVQLLRNNGDSKFTDITTNAGVAAALSGRLAIAATDFDNRRDIDLLIAGGARGALLYRNLRDGTFRNASADVGFPQVEGVTALALADVNKDSYPDVFLGRRGAGVLSLSDGKGRFQTAAVPGEADATVAAQLVDYDNDGLVDLFTLSERGARLFRNIGDGWTDASTAARLNALTPSANVAFQSMSLGDVDGDGDDDVVIRQSDGKLRVWRNEGGERNASLRVRLTGRVSNRGALGAKVDLRAGSLRQTIETSASAPAVAPADVIFGLGSRTAADAVRVLWPSGIVQAETPASKPARAAVLPITELDRKPSSCPFLFTWNGSRFEFVTDFMGGGEMGDWVAPSVWNQPDPDEYVVIRGDQLQPRNGRYELRITNELEEVLFVDRLQLVAVDHRADVSVYPNEGLRQPPRAPFRPISTRNARPPLAAHDEHGHDVLARIASRDRLYPNDFGLLPIRGYAAPHSLTLDLGAGSDQAVLLLTGWTDYAFSNDNVAASQARIEMQPPALQVKDAGGAWKTVIPDVGFPVGRPQTIAVDLTGKFLSRSREVRILTNMRIYWDQIQVAASAASAPKLTRLDPASADLHWRGFSRETTPDGREPIGYDYERVSTITPWKTFVGRYTREGDVRELVRRVDDMFVISRPGDEIALSFDATALPPRAAGWTRSFLLYAHGYSKEMNPRSASPDTIGPLPFRAMSKYPYAADEHYPDTPQHRDYLARYNTRVVTRTMPPIDTMTPQR
jgi:VCBS repeat protein/ASPIC/UnbV protein/tetratricopeptide repeat protein